MDALDLPRPDEDAAAHGVRVARHLAARIGATGGELPFAAYMQEALYAPGLGYYSAGSTKLGAEGDFITAPELSPVFSRCLAAQAREVLAACGGDTVLEIGAGSGRMAADLLSALAVTGDLPARYLILETSADLRERQRTTLAADAAAVADRVTWVDAWPESPVTGLVIANEVLDALPVDAFLKREGVIRQRTVVSTDTGFGWSDRPAPQELAAAVGHIESACGAFAEGYTSEVNLILPAWMTGVAGVLERGVVLFMDYGMERSDYYAVERSMGTLRCHYRHRVHDDPFIWPGLQDITAQVDFTAVAEAGVAAGLTLAGYTTQMHFLLGCGYGDDALDAGAKRLVMPGEMGEAFKAMAFARGFEAPLRGFSIRDFSDRL